MKNDEVIRVRGFGLPQASKRGFDACHLIAVGYGESHCGGWGYQRSCDEVEHLEVCDCWAADPNPENM